MNKTEMASIDPVGKLDTGFKARWIAALRSGKYKQGKSKLRKDDYYCCLGVGCDISGVGEWRHFIDAGCHAYAGATACLPASVSEAIGLGHVNTEFSVAGLLDKAGNTVLLTTLNDTGFTFSQIADIIEHFL